MAKGIYIGVDNIARKVKKMYIGKEGKASKVIKGYVGVKETYKVLDYIESTGTQYIDALGPITSSTRIELDFQLTSLPTTEGAGIVGAYQWNEVSQTNDGMLLGVYNNNFQFAYASGFAGSSIPADLNRHIAIMNINNQCTLDGNKLIDSSNPNGSLPLDKNIYIFATNGGTGTNRCAMKVYSYKKYEDNILVQDFIPIQTDTGVVCLYDRVTKKKFYNIGTNSFIAGNETGETIVVSFARQFFPSAFYPKYKMMFTANDNNYGFSMVTHTKDYIIVAGGQTSSTNTPNNNVYAYDKNAVEYSVSSLTTKAGNGGSMSISDYGIVAGGFTAASWSNRTSQVLAYNNNLSKTTLSDLTTAVFEPACASNEEHCICLAGSNYSSNSLNAQSYSKDLVKTSIAQTSYYRRSKSGSGVGKYLVFCGTIDSASGKTDFYDNSNVKITASDPYNKVCFFPLGVSTNKYAIFFGGATSDSNSKSFNDIKAYDESLVLLTSSMPTALYKMNGFTVKGQFVVVGRTSTFYVYDENLVLQETITPGSSIGNSNSYLGASTNDFGIIRGGWTNNSVLFEF